MGACSELVPWHIKGLILCRVGNHGEWCKKYGLWFGYCFQLHHVSLRAMCCFLHSGVFWSTVGWCEILGALKAVMCQISVYCSIELSFCTLKCFMQHLLFLQVQNVTLKCKCKSCQHCSALHQRLVAVQQMSSCIVHCSNSAEVVQMGHSLAHRKPNLSSEWPPTTLVSIVI